MPVKRKPPMYYLLGKKRACNLNPQDVMFAGDYRIQNYTAVIRKTWKGIRFVKSSETVETRDITSILNSIWNASCHGPPKLVIIFGMIPELVKMVNGYPTYRRINTLRVGELLNCELKICRAERFTIHKTQFVLLLPDLRSICSEPKLKEENIMQQKSLRILLESFKIPNLHIADLQDLVPPDCTDLDACYSMGLYARIDGPLPKLFANSFSYHLGLGTKKLLPLAKQQQNHIPQNSIIKSTSRCRMHTRKSPITLDLNKPSCSNQVEASSEHCKDNDGAAATKNNSNHVTGQTFIIRIDPYGSSGQTSKSSFDCVVCNDICCITNMRLLYKHVKTRLHVMNVMELEDYSSYEVFKKCPNIPDNFLLKHLTKFEMSQEKKHMTVATSETLNEVRKKIKQNILMIKASRLILPSSGNEDFTSHSDQLNKMLTETSEYIELLPKIERKLGRRIPKNLVIVMDERDDLTKLDSIPIQKKQNYNILRISDQSYSKVLDSIKKHELFNEGTLFLVFSSIFLFIESQVDPNCILHKCKNPVNIYKYQTEGMILKALTFLKEVLDATNSDAVIFSDIVPFNIYGANQWIIKNSKCCHDNAVETGVSINEHVDNVNKFNIFIKLIADKFHLPFLSFETLNKKFSQQHHYEENCFHFLKSISNERAEIIQNFINIKESDVHIILTISEDLKANGDFDFLLRYYMLPHQISVWGIKHVNDMKVSELEAHLKKYQISIFTKLILFIVPDISLAINSNCISACDKIEPACNDPISILNIGNAFKKMKTLETIKDATKTFKATMPHIVLAPLLPRIGILKCDYTHKLLHSVYQSTVEKKYTPLLIDGLKPKWNTVVAVKKIWQNFRKDYSKSPDYAICSKFFIKHLILLDKKPTKDINSIIEKILLPWQNKLRSFFVSLLPHQCKKFATRSEVNKPNDPKYPKLVKSASLYIKNTQLKKKPKLSNFLGKNETKNSLPHSTISNDATQSNTAKILVAQPSTSIPKEFATRSEVYKPNDPKYPKLVKSASLYIKNTQLKKKPKLSIFLGKNETKNSLPHSTISNDATQSNTAKILVAQPSTSIPNLLPRTATNWNSGLVPNSYSIPPPNSYSIPPPNSYSMPFPNSYSMPLPNSYSMPPPNNYSMPPPNNYSMPPPNNYSMPPPNNYSMPPPNNYSMANLNACSSIPPDINFIPPQCSNKAIPPSALPLTPSSNEQGSLFLESLSSLRKPKDSFKFDNIVFVGKKSILDEMSDINMKARFIYQDLDALNEDVFPILMKKIFCSKHSLCVLVFELSIITSTKMSDACSIFRCKEPIPVITINNLNDDQSLVDSFISKKILNVASLMQKFSVIHQPVALFPLHPAYLYFDTADAVKTGSLHKINHVCHFQNKFVVEGDPANWLPSLKTIHDSWNLLLEVNHRNLPSYQFIVKYIESNVNFFNVESSGVKCITTKWELKMIWTKFLFATLDCIVAKKICSNMKPDFPNFDANTGLSRTKKPESNPEATPSLHQPKVSRSKRFRSRSRSSDSSSSSSSTSSRSRPKHPRLGPKHRPSRSNCLQESSAVEASCTSNTSIDLPIPDSKTLMNELGVPLFLDFKTAAIKLRSEMNEEFNGFVNVPQSHPDYKTYRKAFDRKYEEELGKGVDLLNREKVWSKFWSSHTENLLKTSWQKRIQVLLKNYGGKTNFLSQPLETVSSLTSSESSNSKQSNPIDLQSIANSCVGKSTEFIINMIKTVHAYAGLPAPSKETINEMFHSVCDIHFQMTTH